MVRPLPIVFALKRYLLNCNLHGVRYLVEDSFHWTERVFWSITCALCWFACAVMIKDSLDGFYYRPTAFTAESTYIEWDTDFPSISICIHGHPDATDIAGALYKEKFGQTIRFPHAWGWLFATSVVKNNPKTDAQLSKLTSDDVVRIYEESFIKCKSLMDECFWRTTFKFNCCDEFLPLRTATGICYVFNSRHTRSDASLKKFIMNQNTGVGYLTIGLRAFTFYGGQSSVRVSINNNLVIPTAAGIVGMEIDTFKYKVNTVYFTLEDTFNDPGLQHIPPERRKCRFPEETENFYAYRRYSNSGCLIQIQMENMLRVCGCISHLFPYPEETPVCNFTGQRCLSKNEETIMAKDNLGKQCLPDCEGTVMRNYQNVKVIQTNSSLFKVSQGIHLELLGLPTVRYRRYVVRSLLDLVVAIGSTAGLFMGAGILSLVEIPYWLLLRHSS